MILFIIRMYAHSKDVFGINILTGVILNERTEITKRKQSTIISQSS